MWVFRVLVLALVLLLVVLVPVLLLLRVLLVQVLLLLGQRARLLLLG